MIIPGKSKTLYKYLLTYTITLLIPLVLFIYLINTSILSSLENQALEAVKGNLRKVREQTEQKFSEMERIAVSISVNTKLSSFFVKGNYYKVYEIINELKSYKFGNFFIYDILYYVKGHDIVYAASQSSDVFLLFNEIYHFENWDYNQIINDLNKIEAPLIRPAEKLVSQYYYGQEVIAYIYPVRPFDSNAVVIFLIDNEKMKEMQKSIFTDYDENVLIINNEGKEITSLESGIHAESYWQHLVDAHSDYMVSHTDNQYISSTKSDNGRMTFVSIVPKEKIMSIVNGIKKQVYLFVLIALLAGFLVITLAIQLNYIPIRRLHAKITSKVETDLESRDEMVAMDMLFDKVISLNEKLNQDAEKYKQVLRKYVLNELVKGGSNLNPEEVYNNLPEEDSRFFRVIVFKFTELGSHPNDEIYSERFWYIFREFMTDGTEFFSISNMEENRLIAVLSYDDNQSNDSTKVLVQKITDSIGQKLGIKLLTGVGGAFKEILSIGESYTQALKALRYRIKDGKSNVFYFNEMNPKEDYYEDIYPYPYDDMKKLSLRMRTGNFQNIKATLERLLGTLIKNDTPEFFIRCIAFDIFNMLMRILVEKGINLRSIVVDFESALFNRNRSPEELFERLSAVLEKVCGCLPAEQEDENTLMSRVIQYIRENFRNYDFSVEQMASELGTSSSYLSQIFKENIGDTLSEYIWNLRRDTAKHLLKTSSLAIKDIVQSVGYIDVSSFNRKFKKDEGVTPGEYRQIIEK